MAAYAIGFTAVVLLMIQEYRIHRLTERLLLQANVPQVLGPVRTSAPVSVPDIPDTRKKIFSVKIPG